MSHHRYFAGVGFSCMALACASPTEDSVVSASGTGTDDRVEPPMEPSMGGATARGAGGAVGSTEIGTVPDERGSGLDPDRDASAQDLPEGGPLPLRDDAGLTPPATADDPRVAGAPGTVIGSQFGLGGPSLCNGEALAICESFENTDLGVEAPAGWATGGYGNRSLSVVDDESARGGRSLRIDIGGDQGAVVAMIVREDLGSLRPRHFGRSFMKIDAPAPVGFVHFDVFEARGQYQGQTNMVRWASTGTNVGEGASNWSWIYNVQSTTHGEFGTEGDRSSHPRQGEWMCLEWSMAATPQEARFWYDGSEIDYLHIDTERTEIPEMDSFHVGFQKFQRTSGAWRVWVDEVAFDEARIGCDH